MHWSWCWRLARPALRLRAPGSISLSRIRFGLPLAEFRRCAARAAPRGWQRGLIVEIGSVTRGSRLAIARLDRTHALFLVRRHEGERGTSHFARAVRPTRWM